MHTLRRHALGVGAIAVWAVTGLAAGAAYGQTPFYAGKQLSMIINFGAGSSTDIEARLFGRHISKHIDGHPTIVMQNKPGAGGLLGGLYLGEVADKDGTAFGFLTALGWAYASRSQDFRVDLKSYEFIGFSSGAAIYFIRSDVAPGIKTATDIGKVQSFVSGGVNSRSGRDATIRMTLDMLGVPYKHVSGYRSGEKAMLALQRQEIHFYSTTPPLYRKRIQPNLVSKGAVTPLYVDPSWDGEKLSISK
jgi:tripartite-type tricarboxylate transporter receptor subunit TctC